MPTSPVTPLRFGRLLLTGAAGHLGRVLRPRLAPLAATLRLSDADAKARGLTGGRPLPTAKAREASAKVDTPPAKAPASP